MQKININIDFRKNYSHFSLINDISIAFNANSGDHVDFYINLNNNILYSDLLILIVVLINYLKSKLIHIEIHLVDFNNYSEAAKYASRINFFKHLEIPVNEEFNRHNNSGKFTEIKTFDKDTIYELQDNINRIFLNNLHVDRQMLQMLYYCLNEILDNVLVHSTKPNGFACAQLFPSKNKIRLIICDTGIGIHKSLTSNSKYQNISEQETLNLCIKKGVTDGEGIGFGLFASSEFIKENAGEMLIYSGNNFLKNSKKEFEIFKSNFWQGTIVFLQINTNVPVVYKIIMPTTHNLPENYKDYIEKIFGIDENLW